MLGDIGEDGQQKLAEASVLVVGCGGLGAPVLLYLTAAGVGNIGLCDGDKVSLSNLNRQVLFSMDDIGLPKASTAEKRLLALNPCLVTTAYDVFIDDAISEDIISKYDIIVDCLDNFETRFIINDACIRAQKPLVHAGVGEYYGQLMTIVPGKGPCLRCLFPNGIEKVSQKKVTGVIGPTPGVVGSMQALEVIKYLLDLKLCDDGLMIYDGLNLRVDKVEIKPPADCICRTS
jgi:adenylyltransferase/sulfurtransferase